MKRNIENKNIFSKVYFWIITLIVFGIIAAVTEIVELYNISIFGYTHYIFLIAALICGIKAVKLIVKTKTIFKISGMIQLIIIVSFALYIYGFEFKQINIFRNLNGINTVNLENLQIIRGHIQDYIVNNKYLPDANSWCDEIKPDGVTIDLYRRFAFNRNLSGLSIDQLNGNEVLILESNDGNINNYGGSELIDQRLMRDEYCIFPWQKVTYILFVDGTIAQYRRSDGEISLYNEKDVFVYWYQAFGPFAKKGETQYSPLQWDDAGQN